MKQQLPAKLNISARINKMDNESSYCTNKLENE